MLQKLYEVARNNMSVSQLRSATYYDKKVADEELQVGELLYVFYPSIKSKKLAHKWFSPYCILQAKHPAYEINLGTKSQWLTRDKLKVTPKNSQSASPFKMNRILYQVKQAILLILLVVNLKMI